MDKVAQVVTWVGLVAGVLGGIAEVTGNPILIIPRAWAGLATILLLFAIALNTRKQ